ncbi:MAG TPA: alpha/beta hydrolase [Bdellovibrionota bacterium]|nr:alpha/beta hydrolase [Bdellovibrionota bacterium]
MQQSAIVAHHPGNPWPRDGRQSWFSFADCCIHGIEFKQSEGAKASVLFLHGRYGDATLWAAVARELGSSARCLSIDLPGFGDSYSIRRGGLSLIESAVLIEHAIEQFATPGEPVVLVGHDIGGTVVLMSGTHLMNRVAGVAVLNPACLTRPAEGFQSGTLAWRLRRRARLQCNDSRILSADLRDELLQPWQSRAARRSRVNALRLIERSWPGHYERLAWKRELSRMPHPVLILWGSRDRMNPPALGTELLHQLPNADLLEDPACSHWLPLENPAWVGRKLREFLFRVRGPARRVPA